MVELTEEIKAAMATVKAFPVATASKKGIPNVVPIGFCRVADGSTIWIADNFMRKSLANVKENPKVAIFVWGPETKGCWQIKGDVEIKTSGPEFEEMQEWVFAKMARASAKSLLIVKVTEVYQCAPGPNAGERLL